jgi:hypothetical protein
VSGKHSAGELMAEQVVQPWALHEPEGPTKLASGPMKSDEEPPAEPLPDPPPELERLFQAPRVRELSGRAGELSERDRVALSLLLRPGEGESRVD